MVQQQRNKHSTLTVCTAARGTSLPETLCYNYYMLSLINFCFHAHVRDLIYLSNLNADRNFDDTHEAMVFNLVTIAQ